jgi:hypothetical protein
MPAGQASAFGLAYGGRPEAWACLPSADHWPTTRSSLPPIIRLSDCDLLELVANSSGVIPLPARVSALVAVLISSP